MTQVIIDDVIPRTQLIASAGQTVFNTNWTANVASDVLVYARAAGVAPDDETQLVSSTDYNVTFIGGSATVRVTFLSGRTLNDVITIVRNTPAERMNLYINTNFVPSMLNEDFGILTLVDQQAQMYDVLIAPHYNVSATIEPESMIGGGDVVLPILPPGFGWRKNLAGTAIEAISIPDGGFAPADATYLLQVADSDLPNAQAMGALASGFVVNTTTTGVQLTRVFQGTADQIDITDPNGIGGNPVWSIADNVILGGTSGMGLIRGTTAERPLTPGANTFFRFNTTDEYLEYWDGANWIQIVEDAGILIIHGTANQIDVDSTDPAEPILSLSATLDAPGTFTIQGTIVLDSIIDDDTFATATDTNIPTSESVKEYVDTSIANFYEEGTWTPAITANTPGSPTHSAQNGWYSKLGNIVTVWFSVQLSNLGGMSGGVRITGLPFDLVAASPGARGQGLITTAGNMTNYFPMVIHGHSGDTMALFNGEAYSQIDVFATDLTNTTALGGLFVYQTE